MARKHRILIIDDSETTIAGLEAYLGEKYNVITATNGRDGIHKFEKNEKRIHLVLTDLILPDFVGATLISLIKNEATGKPVIAMTGWEYHPDEFESKVNADLILKKPFEMEELDQTIEKLFSEKHKEKARSKPTLKKRKQRPRISDTQTEVICDFETPKKNDSGEII
jgi:two-component system, cell cycle response regulator